MTTPYTQRGPLRGARRHPGRTPATGGKHAEAVDLLALVAHARREPLLRAHRHRLRREDLEDCYSQATLELLAHLRRGLRLSGRRHLDHVLEQRFLSRVRDRRRALHGRSPLAAALERSVSLDTAGGENQLVDPRADVHTLVARRLELRGTLHSLPALSADERLVLASQALLGIGRAEFCGQHDWSFEKYRKVAQRGRARLRALSEAELRFQPPPPGRRYRQPDERPPAAACPAPAGPVGRGDRDRPMHIDHPPHRRVPRDAGDRFQARPHGDPAPRASGRGPGDHSPARLPAARVPRRSGGEA